MIFLPSVPLHALRVCARICFLAAAAVAALVFGGISLLWLSPPLLFILALADCPMHCPCALILLSSVGHVFGLRVFSFIVAVVVRSASSSLCFASPPSLGCAASVVCCIVASSRFVCEAACRLRFCVRVWRVCVFVCVWGCARFPACARLLLCVRVRARVCVYVCVRACVCIMYG